MRVEIGEPIPKAEILEKESKIIRSQGFLFDADLIPNEIARAILHVFSVRLDGDYTTNLMNTGVLPLFRARIDHTLNQADLGVDLFKNRSEVVGRIGKRVRETIRTAWRVEGVIGILWALINILFTGSCTVKQTATVSALGFTKEFAVRARVPVKAVAVEWN